MCFQKEPKKTKKQAKQIELRVESEFPEYTPLKVQELVEIEMEMRSQDKAAKEKADARNSLEEYIYEFRDKISGDYSDFISDHVSLFVMIAERRDGSYVVCRKLNRFDLCSFLRWRLICEDFENAMKIRL